MHRSSARDKINIRLGGLQHLPLSAGVVFYPVLNGSPSGWLRPIGLQELLPLEFGREGREKGGGEVERGDTAGCSVGAQAGDGAGTGDEDAACQRGVGIRLQSHGEGVGMVGGGFSAPNDPSAVRQFAVIPGQFLLRDKGDRCFVALEVVRHGADIPLDFRAVRAVLCNDVALPPMGFCRGQSRKLSVLCLLCGFGNGDGIFSCIPHARQAADGIGMPLADPSAPEGHILTVRQDGGEQGTRRRKQPRIPACADEREMSRRTRGAVDCGEVRGDFLVRVETVDRVEVGGKSRGLARQVGCAPAAEQQDVDPILPMPQGGERQSGDVAKRSERLVRAAGEDGDKVDVRRGKRGAFRAFSEVAVAADCDSDIHQEKASLVRFANRSAMPNSPAGLVTRRSAAASAPAA